MSGRLPADLPAPIATGIALHRRIDAYTDRHPLSQAARADFEAGARRYAGIVLDIVHDHLLAQAWPTLGIGDLAVFCTESAMQIEVAGPWFERLSGHTPSAFDFERLLRSYAEVDGVERALQRTARRLRDPDRFLAATAGWQRRTPALTTGLAPLLGDLHTEAERFLRAYRAAQVAAPDSASN